MVASWCSFNSMWIFTLLPFSQRKGRRNMVTNDSELTKTITFPHRPVPPNHHKDIAWVRREECRTCNSSQTGIPEGVFLIASPSLMTLRGPGILLLVALTFSFVALKGGLAQERKEGKGERKRKQKHLRRSSSSSTQLIWLLGCWWGHISYSDDFSPRLFEGKRGLQFVVW